MPGPHIFSSALELIGSTPMVELTHFDTGPCRLFVKLESQNPGGSIKDRIGLSMIEAAERDGKIKPGGTLVEATAGNTGLGLAQVAILKGYRVLLVVPDKMAREKIQHLRALGADVRITRSDVGKGHPEYYQDMAERLAGEMENAFFVNQFANPANPEAHEKTTGPEIWEQMEHDVDAIVLGIGSGGTFTGIGRFFRRVSPKTEMVLADPVGSILAPLRAHRENDRSGIVDDRRHRRGFHSAQCRHVARFERLFDFGQGKRGDGARAAVERRHSRRLVVGHAAGGGACAIAASRRSPSASSRSCRDSGNKYLSKVYNDYWVIEQGLADRKLLGNLSDLIARRFDAGGAVTVGPDDTLLIAYNRMRAADVSQLPVVKDKRIVGILDESDILATVEGDDAAARRALPRSRAQRDDDGARTVQVSEKLKVLAPMFERNEVAIVLDGENFVGLITRIDLINHLRLNP